MLKHYLLGTTQSFKSLVRHYSIIHVTSQQGFPVPLRKFSQFQQVRSFATRPTKTTPKHYDTSFQDNQQKQSSSQKYDQDNILSFQDSMSEFDTIYQHVQGAQNKKVTLEQQVETLRDDPDDQRALIDVLALVVERDIETEADFLAIPHKEDINDALKKHLKADRIDPKDYGLVHMFLQKMGGSPATFEYAILRTHQNIRKCPLLNIGLALMNVPFLQDVNKQQTFFKRVENYLLTTHESLYKGKNLNGLLQIVDNFGTYRLGSADLWRKLEKLLVDQFSKKRQPLHKDQAIDLVKVLAKQKLTSTLIWQSVLEDIQISMEGNFLDMKDIYYLVKSLFSVQISLPQIYQTIADYIVDRGYDHEDLAALGVNRGASLVYNLVIANPQLNNLNFIVHVQNFIRENINEFSQLSLAKMVDAFKASQSLNEQELFQRLEDRLTAKRVQSKTGPGAKEVFENHVLFSDDSEQEMEENEQGFEVNDDEPRRW